MVMVSKCKSCNKELPKEKISYITNDIETDNDIEVKALVCSCGTAHYETNEYIIFEFMGTEIKDSFDIATYVKTNQEVAIANKNQ